MNRKFSAGVALVASGLLLCFTPVMSASAVGAWVPPTAPTVQAAPSGGVLAVVTVHGRPWAGRPGG